MFVNKMVLLLLAVMCSTVLLQVAGDADNDPKGIPTSYDLRDSGIMTPVKHQLECGSCGEFAAIALLEALIKRESGSEIDLSEQEIIDCVPGCGCEVGCSSLQVLEHLKVSGVSLESENPYLSKDDTCRSGTGKRYCLSKVHSTTIHGLSLTERIQAIKSTILTYGPVATNMRFFEDLDRYRSGVYTYDGKSQEMGGHWVLIIGWKDSPDNADTGYWICRNSWGKKWGEGGYFNSVYGDITGIDDFYIVYGEYREDKTD